MILVHPYFQHEKYNNDIATIDHWIHDHILSLLQLQKGDMYSIVFYHGEDNDTCPPIF